MYICIYIYIYVDTHNIIILYCMATYNIYTIVYKHRHVYSTLFLLKDCGVWSSSITTKLTLCDGELHR